MEGLMEKGELSKTEQAELGKLSDEYLDSLTNVTPEKTTESSDDALDENKASVEKSDIEKQSEAWEIVSHGSLGPVESSPDIYAHLFKQI